MFTEAYAVLPRGTMTDIVTSLLPFWDNTRLWVIARPLSGFAETFSQYIVEVSPGGGSDKPELDPGAEGVLFVVAGGLTLTLGDATHELAEGGYAFIPPGQEWSLHNRGDAVATFHWIRKAYQVVEGIERARSLCHQRVRRRRRGDARDRRGVDDPAVRRPEPTCATTCTSTS